MKLGQFRLRDTLVDSGKWGTVGVADIAAVAGGKVTNE